MYCLVVYRANGDVVIKREALKKSVIATTSVNTTETAAMTSTLGKLFFSFSILWSKGTTSFIEKIVICPI